MYYYSFNTTLAPFDDPLGRQAFASALDRAALAEIANGLNPGGAYEPATTFTPPDVLGLDLYGQVGLSYDPDRANALLAEAGYAGGENLPDVTLWYNEVESGFHQRIAEAMRDQWEAVLGVAGRLRDTEMCYRPRSRSSMRGLGANCTFRQNVSCARPVPWSYPSFTFTSGSDGWVDASFARLTRV